jgi:hypothetical protein
MKDSKQLIVFWIVYAISNFCVFAYDLENDKDWLTYGWLLATIISFCMFIIYGVRFEILRALDENKK